MKRPLLFYLLCILVITSSCSKKTVRKAIDPIDYSDYDSKTDLVVQYSIDKQVLTDIIDSLIDENIKDAFVTDQYNITVSTKRTSEVGINVNKKSLLIKVPLSLELTKQTFLGDIKGRGDLTFFISSEISIDKYWNLKTTSSLQTYEWTKKPTIELGVKLPATYIADQAITRIAPELLSMIDQQISANIDLTDRMQSLIPSLETPYRLHDQYGIWYNPTVLNIGMTDFVDEKYIIKSKLIVDLKNEISSQKPIKKQSNGLPPFLWLNDSDDSSTVSVFLDLQYSSINQHLREKFVGQVFTEGKRTVKVEDVKLSGLAGYLQVETKLSGSYNGLVTMIGLPMFDRRSKSLVVSDLDVDFDTKNIIAKGASWLFEGKIRRELTKMLNLPLGEPLQQLQESLDVQLENYQKENHIYYYAKLGDIDLQNVYYSDDRINGICSFKMLLTAHINNKRFFVD